MANTPLNFCSGDNTATGGLNEEFDTMSASRCRNNCLADSPNAAYAVVSYRDCWCSDYAPSDEVDVSSCGTPCPGWPPESCASSGFYGYMELGPAPAGTAGGSSSTPEPSSTPASTPSPSSSSDPETQLDTSTVVQTSVNTVVSTRIAESTPSATPTPIVSFIIITQPGGVSTRFVTSTPTLPAAPSLAVEPSSQQDLPVAHSSGLSNGAVAGITVGSILGAILVGAFLFFFCWKKRRGARDQEGGIRRNTSVLSKVGLLRSGSQKPVMTQQPPRLQTSGSAFASANVGPGPASAGTLASDSQMSESRRSRPLFVDQRLNPNALFAQSNTSRTSIGTLQDNQDYSRPLEVRNPDL